MIGSFSLSRGSGSPEAMCWKEFAREDEDDEDNKGGSSILEGVDAMGGDWMEGSK